MHGEDTMHAVTWIISMMS